MWPGPSRPRSVGWQHGSGPRPAPTRPPLAGSWAPLMVSKAARLFQILWMVQHLIEIKYQTMKHDDVLDFV